ncbi:MAG: thioredoxin family protein [Kofleriaceae bacterium]
MKRLMFLLVACGQPVEPAKPEPPAPAKELQLNKPGETVNIEAGLAPGYVTVVDFWAESCGACHVVGAMLEKGVAADAKILIRKVDVGDGFTPVAEAYSVGALPHYRVYDKKGRMRYMLVGNDCTKASEIAKQLAAEP